MSWPNVDAVVNLAVLKLQPCEISYLRNARLECLLSHLFVRVIDNAEKMPLGCGGSDGLGWCCGGVGVEGVSERGGGARLFVCLSRSHTCEIISVY